MSPGGGPGRETFATRLGALAAMVGLAVGLGNVWRFPYMAGRFGGSAFVLLYLLLAVLVAIPALVGEWSLGRHARHGCPEVYARVGMPGGRGVGWLLIAVTWAALAYYTNAIGWVGYHAAAELLRGAGRHVDAGEILPPPSGFSARAFTLQAACTATTLALQTAVVLRGIRRGIERASRVLTPVLFLTLVVVVVRSLTLPGGGAGVRWFLGFTPAAITPAAVLAALGQVVFSVGLGGTMMVVYGSYLDEGMPLPRSAAWTVAGDTGAGLLAGLAIFPAVFAFGLEPGSGPALLFDTLPRVFREIPAGWLFGALFFGGLAGAAVLSGIAALEVVVSGLADALGWTRARAAWTVSGGAMLLALPPMINLRIFIPWDLTFGSGGQTVGALAAVLTVGWVMERGALLHQVGGASPAIRHRALVVWLRWVVPLAVGTAGVWWLLTEVLGVAPAA